MGQGGYITLYNDTDYDMVRSNWGRYQMAFDAPDRIPAHQSRKFYAEWWESGVKDDDSAYADYIVQDGTGRIVTIEAWARPGRHFQMNFKSYSQPGYPQGSIVNIGWIHDGNVGFSVKGLSVPKPEPCFLAGSLILTRNGYVPVEKLKLGDKLLVREEGKHRFSDLVFIGRGMRNVDRSGLLGADESGWPVCIRAHALGHENPRRDLWLTAEHCVFVENALVPIRLLVNGESIFYDKTKPTYDYYHLGTPRHEVIIAENLYTESYLPGDNASWFEHVEQDATSSLDPASAYPIRTERSFVEPLYRSLVDRLDEDRVVSDDNTLMVTNDPALQVVKADGTPLPVCASQNGMPVFEVEANIDRLFIRSRSGRPCDSMGSFVDDRRRLGVLISSILFEERMQGSGIEIDFRAPALRGWCVPEHGLTRWTQGSAEIVIPERQRAHGGRLLVQVVHNGPYRIQKKTRQMPQTGSDDTRLCA